MMRRMKGRGRMRARWARVRLPAESLDYGLWVRFVRWLGRVFRVERWAARDEPDRPVMGSFPTGTYIRTNALRFGAFPQPGGKTKEIKDAPDQKEKAP